MSCDPDLVRDLDIELPVEGVVDRDRRPAAITAGAALVTDLCLDPRQLCQSDEPVRTDAFALFRQIVMKLTIAVDLAALVLGLAQQFDLAPVLPHARALSGGTQPSIEPARLDAQAATHRPHRKLTSMLSHERCRHWARTNGA